MSIKTSKGETYVGAVLDHREENHHDDSDWYAIVWDSTAQGIKRVYYDSTRYASDGSHAVTDATEEVKAKAREWLKHWAILRITEKDADKAHKVEKGKRVRVVKGRKVAHGTEGLVFWLEEQTYSPRYRNGYRQGPDAIKIGIATSDRKDERNRYVDVAWTYAHNVQVIDPVYMTDDEIERQAEQWAKQELWYVPFAKATYVM